METWSLSSAPNDIRAMEATLGQSRVCTVCSAQKDPLEAVVADAGQMFETIDPALAVQAVQDALQAVSIMGYSYVHVCRFGKPQARLATCQRCEAGWVSFSFLELLHCFQAAMAMNFVQVGNKIFVLTKGVLIGGLLARVAAAYVPALDERKINTEVRQFWGLTRYIDDILMLSRALCHKCMCCQLAHTYTTVSFTPEPRARVIKFLDIELFLDRSWPGHLCFGRYCHNEAWLLSQRGSPVKHRYGPWLSGWPQSFSVARGIWLGLLARHDVLQLDLQARCKSLMLEILELLRIGTPRGAVRALVFSLGLQYKEVVWVRKAMFN